MSRKKKIWKEKKRLHFVFSLGKLDDGKAGKSLVSDNNNNSNKPRFDSSFRVVRFGSYFLCAPLSLSLSLSLSFSQKSTQKVCVWAKHTKSPKYVT